MKLKPYSRRVYYYETDKMGVVHHSNYIRWFEEARIDVIAQAGMPFQLIEDKGIWTPVLSAECNYIRPFRLGEEFFVKAYIPDFGGARFSVTYEINDAEGNICITGKTTHCFVDTNMRPIRIKKSHPEIYAVYDELCKSRDGLYEGEC